MSNKNSKLKAQSSKVLLIVLVFGSSITAFGQTIIRSSTPNKPKINFAADIQFTYDDNIFLYSEKDLKDFERSIQAYRFPFETSDDFITTLTGSIGLRHKLFNQKSTVFSLLYRQHIYAINRIKSYQLFSLIINQNLAKPLAIEIGYLFLPKYLIRYYKDPTSQISPPTYIGCEFAEHLISAELNFRVKKELMLTPSYKFEIDNYIRQFNFYDTKAHRLSLIGGYRVIPTVELKGKFEYKTAQAEGPAPDISYDQLAWAAGIQFGKDRKISASYGQARREFTTNNSPFDDPYHAGRIDKTQNIKLELEIPITRIILVAAGYEFEKRTVSSPSKETIDEVKDYQNNRFGLGLKFRRF